MIQRAALFASAAIATQLCRTSIKTGKRMLYILCFAPSNQTYDFSQQRLKPFWLAHFNNTSHNV